MVMTRRLAVGLLALCLLAGTQARAQVLDMVPSDAMVVVKVKNLGDLNQKVAFLAEDWGLAAAQPQLKDPLGFLLGMAGLGAGIDKAGEAAIAMRLPAQGQGEPDVIAMLPVTDYQAFAKTLPNAKPDGEFTSFTAGNETVFAAERGKFAAISDKKALLAKPAQAIVLPAGVAREIAARDIVAYVNMKVVRDKALPEFQKNKQMFLQAAEQGMNQAQKANPQFAPVLKAYIQQLVALVEGFLKESEAVTFGLNLSREGIASSLVVEFTKDGYMGKALSKMKNTDASFTAGLPEGNYVLYGGMALDPEGIRMINDFLAPIEKELAKMGPEGRPLVAYFDATRKMMGAMKSANFGILTPGVAGMVKSGLIQSVTVATGDAAAMKQAQDAVIAQQQELMKMTGTAGLSMNVKTTAAAKTVQGVQLDQTQMTITGKPQTQEEQMASFMLKMMFGMNGMTTYTGMIDQQKLISVMGADDNLLENAVSAAKTNADPLGKGIAELKGAVAQNRLAAFYLPIDRITKTVLDFMAMRGLPAGVKIPDNLPPLAGTIAADGASLRIEGYAPEKTIKAMISAGLQLYLMEMPGDKAGGPARP